MSSTINANLISAINEGKPLKSYRKTILGKVYVTMIDPISESSDPVVGHLMEGNPDSDPRAIIDVYSEREDLFFRRQNKRHFDTGVIVPYTRPKEGPKVELIAQAGDDELLDILNMKWFSFIKKINEIEEEAVIYRLLVLAESEDKSHSFVTALQSRLVQIQTGNLPDTE